MTAIHTPYDPEQVIGEIGWLWRDDSPGGPEWRLVRTLPPPDDEDDADRDFGLSLNGRTVVGHLKFAWRRLPPDMRIDHG
jgi:hypothetical protein